MMVQMCELATDDAGSIGDVAATTKQCIACCYRMRRQRRSQKRCCRVAKKDTSQCETKIAGLNE